MEKYRVRLADQKNGEPTCPWETFTSREEAEEIAAFRCANHKLPFEVLGPDPRDRGLPLIVLNRFDPR